MLDVKFTPNGADDLKHLPKDLQSRILKKVHFFSIQENPLVFSKSLVNLPPVTHRFRVGDYRIAFFVKSGTIFVDRVKHRKEVYLD
jgi:mRNA-degrading endonuclease RelE of RelBE toxin-antitoxin system